MSRGWSRSWDIFSGTTRRDSRTCARPSPWRTEYSSLTAARCRSSAPIPRGARVGIVHNLEWIEPASLREEDVAAAMRHDGAFNRWFLDPIFRGSYPGDMSAWYGPDAPVISPGDMETIAAPVDFLGVNFYTRRVIAHDPAGRGTAGQSRVGRPAGALAICSPGGFRGVGDGAGGAVPNPAPHASGIPPGVHVRY